MKCDLILPVWNQLAYTQECIGSLFNTVDVPSRLIVVDNGSNDGTAEYLKQLSPPPLLKIEVVSNASNLGYGKAVNQGLKMADAQFVCILNNDTVFGSQWLSTMIDIAYRDNRVGVVNPESSTFGLRPAKGQTVEELAQTLAPRRRDYEELGNAIGFCMLIKRDVLRQAGLFDDTFLTAFFEDTDYCMRAKRAGYICVKACGAYVYHHEHKTVEAIPDREKLFAENRLKYEQKWGRILRVLCPYVFKGREQLRDSLFDLMALARNECYVDMLFFSRKETVDDVFRYAGLRPHANIRPVLCGGGGFLRTMMQILRKRKKPYDLLLCNDLDLAHAFSRLHWLHRLPIYMQRAGVDDLGKCFDDCHVHVVDNFQKLAAMKKA